MKVGDDLDIIEMLMEINNLIGGIEEIEQVLNNISNTIAFIVLMIALIQCFFGYKLLKVQVAIAGFLIFGVIGAIVGATTTFEAETAMLYGFIAGIAGALLAFLLFQIGLFLLFGFSGFIVSFIFTQDAEVSAISGVVLAVAGLFVVKPLVIISTSVAGGLLAGSSLAEILADGNPGFSVFASILFIILGLLVQFDLIKGLNKEAEQKKKHKNTPQNLDDKFQKEISLVKYRINETKQVSMNDALVKIEILFYKSRFFKYFMPFAEYLFIAFILIYMMVESMQSILPIVLFSLMIVVKRKFDVFVIGLFILFMYALMTFLLNFDVMTFGERLNSGIELFILGYLFFNFAVAIYKKMQAKKKSNNVDSVANS